MESISRDFYELKFEISFLKKTSQEFEDFFSEIMEKRHKGGDFIRVRPWGNTGDRKNDGYLKSQRRLFQVYAPNEMTAADALKKINEDYHGAIPHWEKYFDHWEFVHNSRRGLSPQVLELILELDEHHESISVDHFGYESLRTKFFELAEEDIISLVGRAPTSNSFNGLGFADFKTLLGHMVVTGLPDSTDLRPVPENKLEINEFSELIESLIRFGLKKTQVVRDFFNKWPDVNYGDLVTNSINEEYLRLKEEGIHQDLIFQRLREYVIGGLVITPEIDAASLVLLAYFFEECDIFERERS